MLSSSSIASLSFLLRLVMAYVLLSCMLHPAAPIDNVLSRLGDEAEAIRCYQDAHRMYPADMDVISWLGAFHVKNEVACQDMLGVHTHLLKECLARSTCSMKLSAKHITLQSF